MVIESNLIDHIINITMKSFAAISGELAPLLVDNKNISVTKNVPYGNLPEQILDIYKSRTEKKSKLPITILIHGGGFRFFSKDSHATVANTLASNERLVFNINYRLTPKHPFPAGLIDSILSYSWIIQNAEKYSGDLNNISVVGESAGGNYTLALCLYLFGIKSLDSKYGTPLAPEIKPKHAVIHCGHLHVSNVDRYIENKNLHPLVLRRILQIQKDYLPLRQQFSENTIALADPLVEIEKIAQSHGTLPELFPQIFIPVGDRDPIKGDSIRLAQALETLGQKNCLKVYQGEGHAFYVMPFRKNTKICWNDIFQFLNTF
jgi:acetyl esterase